MKHILSLIMASIAFAGCSNKLYLSSWYKHSVKDKNFRFYHSDSKIRYNVENDDEFLYLSFDVLDQLTIQKILTTGLRLHLDPSGKNKQKHEAQFPIYSDKVPVSELEEYGSKYDQSMLLGKGRLDEMIPTDGYLKMNGNTVPLFNNVDKNGALVSLKFDSTRSLVYSAKINLDSLNLTGNVVSIGFETGAYEMPQQDMSIQQADVTQANQGVTAGDRAMGRGGADPYGINTPGGSTAAGTALRNSNSYNKFIEPIRFWSKVQLASPN
jgi:hypothetical protein